MINDLTSSDMKDLATRIREAKEEAMDILRGLMEKGEEVEKEIVSDDLTWCADMSVVQGDEWRTGRGQYEYEVFGTANLTIFASSDDDTVVYEETIEDSMTLDYQDDLEVYGRCG